MKFAAALLCSFAALLLVGCPTMAGPKKDDTEIHREPPPPTTLELEWDGNDQNAGIVDLAPGGGFFVTPRLRARFMALADRHGGGFTPALSARAADEYMLKAAEGPNYVLTAEGMVRYLELMDREREGRIPTP